MTNYDRIKEMSLTELAEFICENSMDCEDCVGHEYCTRSDGHANGMIKWLKTESEE
jgi:hypothetical protein